MVKNRLLCMILMSYGACALSMENKPTLQAEPIIPKEILSLQALIKSNNRQEKYKLACCVSDSIADLFVSSPPVVSLVIEYAFEPEPIHVDLLPTDSHWHTYLAEKQKIHALALKSEVRAFLAQRQQANVHEEMKFHSAPPPLNVSRAQKKILKASVCQQEREDVQEQSRLTLAQQVRGSSHLRVLKPREKKNNCVVS